MEAERRKKSNKLLDCKSNFVLVKKHNNILFDSQIEIQTLFTQKIKLFSRLMLSERVTTYYYGCVCVCIGGSDIVMGFRYTAG